MNVEHFKGKESFCAPCAAPAVAAVLSEGGTVALSNSKYKKVLCVVGAVAAFIVIYKMAMHMMGPAPPPPTKPRKKKK